MNITSLMGKVQELLESKTFRSENGSIESITVDEHYGKFNLYVDFKNDIRKSYCYSEKNNCFEHVRTVNFAE